MNGSRYLISEVELVTIVNGNKKDRLRLMENIINNNHIGYSKNDLLEDVEKLSLEKIELKEEK